jgi:hypothetical protein
MSGAIDPLYIMARSVLLDALDALGPQRKAVILVGAQAIYLHTGAADLAVAEYTTDADIALDPSALLTAPELESALTAAGFYRGNRVGAWCVSRVVGTVPTRVEVDLMVPEAVGGGGTRAARLAGHAKHVARKARGLEAALIDRSVQTITSLDTGDARSFSVAVAGPAALMISKLHKLQERLAERDQRRVDAKDALDVLRLLRAVPTYDLAKTCDRLGRTQVSEVVTHEALTELKELFGDTRGLGCQLAIRAAGPLVNPDEISESCSILTTDLLNAIDGLRDR